MKKYEILVRDDSVQKVLGFILPYRIGDDVFRFIIHQSPYGTFKTAITEMTTRKRIIDVQFPCIICDELLREIKFALTHFVGIHGAEYLRECRARKPYTTERDEELT